MINTSFRRLCGTNSLLLIIVIATHVYAFFVFGATYWVDSLTYVRLAQALKTSSGLTDFYVGNGYWFTPHIQPAMSLLWLLISRSPVHCQWPILSIFQHAIAAAALYFAFATINHYWPTRWHLLFCGLLSVLPFYQCFHNELLTESLTSSLLIAGVALAVRLLINNKFHTATFLSLLAVMVIVTQLRS